MPVSSDKYRFGPYEARIRTRELYKFGVRLKLRPQPFQVLQVLLERAGDVVTRDEFRQMLWPAETFVDFEHGLNTSVKELRKALSDSAIEPRYIETLPKLGYRIITAVEADAPPSAETEPAVQPAAPVAPVAEPPKRPRNHEFWRIWPYVTVAACVAAMPIGWMLVDRIRGPENSVPVPLMGFPGSVQGPAWSPDGRQVALAWNGEKQERFDIYLMQPGSSQTLRLTTGPGDNVNPAWSPDGRWVAYVSRESNGDGSSLNLVSPLGGANRTVLSSATPMGRVSWLPDGRAVVLEIVPEPQKPAVLWTVWVETGRHRTITFPPQGIPGDTAPAVSPDGRFVTFCRATFWRTAELYVLPLKPDLSPAGPERRITDVGFATLPAWTPNSRRILFNMSREGVAMWQVERDGAHLSPVLGVPGDGSGPSIAKRPGGYTSLVFTIGARPDKILRFGLGHSAEPVELGASSHSQGCPRYSVDGKTLAFTSNRTGNQEIWLAQADGSQPVQLTYLRHPITEAPDWSPSGEQIAFVSQDRANRQIYIVSASGGPAVAITNEKGIQMGGGWSRDGSAYYYTSSRSGRSEVWKAPRGIGQPKQITENGGLCGFESATGTFYYWKGEIGNRGVLYRQAKDGDQAIANGIACRTAPSPRGFYFWSEDPFNLLLYDEVNGRTEIVLPNPKQDPGWFSVSPDGRWLAMNAGAKETSDLMIMEHFR